MSNRRNANRRRQRKATAPPGDGVHLVARHYRKGVRLDTHMHREAQLVYAARGTMQVTTPEGTLAGAARPRGVGAGAAGTFHRRACRYRHAHAVFRTWPGWRANSAGAKP